MDDYNYVLSPFFAFPRYDGLPLLKSVHGSLRMSTPGPSNSTGSILLTEMQN